jgi:uncharacterized cupin superfamily protein
MIPEAPLEQTEHGLWPVGHGWFAVNARNLRWCERPGWGKSVNFTGTQAAEVEEYFPQLGVNLVVLEPGEPNGVYHWETEQEDFLVLYGEALVVIEGEERPLRQWDFVHCPPQTRHVFVGAGTGPCVILAMSSREFQAQGPWGCYVTDEAAARYGASPPEDCQDTDIAYARFTATRPTRYGDGWLPR